MQQKLHVVDLLTDLEFSEEQAYQSPDRRIFLAPGSRTEKKKKGARHEFLEDNTDLVVIPFNPIFLTNEGH